MKLQKTNAADSQQSNYTHTNTHQNQSHSPHQKVMIVTQGGTQRMEINGSHQETFTSTNSNSNQITPAKRQKMESEINGEDQHNQQNQPGVGTAQQASPML
jgi:hypothetical protein